MGFSLQVLWKIRSADWYLQDRGLVVEISFREGIEGESSIR